MAATIDLEQSPQYLSCKETAVLARKALRRAFPGVKFSVRSNTYSGGASIDVSWVDGPTERQVSAVTSPYEGGRFDGMIDMATSVTSWLHDDGSAALAHDAGTEGSRGSRPERIGSPMHGSARMVHFGADYIFEHRSSSAAHLARCAELATPDGRASGEQCSGCGRWMVGDCFVARTDWGVQFVCSAECGGRIIARCTPVETR